MAPPHAPQLTRAQILVARNAKVYFACRSRTKAEEAIAEVASVGSKTPPVFLELDISDFASVRRAAAEFLTYAVARVRSHLTRVPGKSPCCSNWR